MRPAELFVGQAELELLEQIHGQANLITSTLKFNGANDAGTSGIAPHFCIQRRGEMQWQIIS